MKQIDSNRISHFASMSSQELFLVTVKYDIKTIQNQIPIDCSFEGNNNEVCLNRFQIYHNWEKYRWTQTNLNIFLNSTHFSTHSCLYSVIYNTFLLKLCFIYNIFVLNKEGIFHFFEFSSVWFIIVFNGFRMDESPTFALFIEHFQITQIGETKGKRKKNMDEFAEIIREWQTIWEVCYISNPLFPNRVIRITKTISIVQNNANNHWINIKENTMVSPSLCDRFTSICFNY